MIYTTFGQVPVGSYFVPNKFTTVLGGSMLLKRGSDYADPITHDGTCFLGRQNRVWNIDDHLPVGLLEEGEWPTIDYRPVIEAWDWNYIKTQVEKNLFPDREDPDTFDVYGSCWIGTTIGVMPSGKIYALWTTNQTDEDVNRDQQFQEAMDTVVNEKGYLIEYGESGDIFIQKRFTYSEVAEAAGFTVDETSTGHFIWKDKDGQVSVDDFDEEDEAWRDCCITNSLVQS